jgi:hypothetical protein
MARLDLLHSRLQITIALTLAALVLWGLVCALRGGLGRGYLAALGMAQLLILAEAALGLALLIGAARPARLALHIVYGVVACALLPAARAYSRRRADRWAALTYAGACLFLLGVAIRAAQTGG